MGGVTRSQRPQPCSFAVETPLVCRRRTRPLPVLSKRSQVAVSKGLPPSVRGREAAPTGRKGVSKRVNLDVLRHRIPLS